MSYQGWKNYETWSYKLWIDNDEASHTYWNAQARSIYRKRDEDDADWCSTMRYCLAKCLQESVIENCPEIEASVYSDILTANLKEIDYYEIANAIFEDLEIENYQPMKKATV